MNNCASYFFSKILFFFSDSHFVNFNDEPETGHGFEVLESSHKLARHLSLDMFLLRHFSFSRVLHVRSFEGQRQESEGVWSLHQRQEDERHQQVPISRHLSPLQSHLLDLCCSLPQNLTTTVNL